MLVIYDSITSSNGYFTYILRFVVEIVWLEYFKLYTDLFTPRPEINNLKNALLITLKIIF